MSADHIANANAAHPIWIAGGKDFKAWAKRILHRQESGDTSLLLVQVQFAKMALGLEEMPNGGKK